MDAAAFDALMAKAPQAPAQAAPEAPAADTQAAPGEANSELTASIPPGIREGLQAVVDGLQNDPMKAAPGNTAAPGTPAVLEGTMTGAAKGLFETKDFLFGETPPEDRSAFRTTIEVRDKQLDDSSMVTGFASGVGQFAISMIGLGKAQRVAEALPWFGKGLGAVLAAAPKTVESVKAAIAGATAFDPHEERLSNLIQDTPLANPVNAWLAADPSDSAAEGRVKSALESIGLDATIVGVFMGSTRIWKALRQGDTAAASRAVDELEADQKAAVSEGEQQNAEPVDTSGDRAGGDVAPSVGDGLGPDGQAVAPVEASGKVDDKAGLPADTGRALGDTSEPNGAVGQDTIVANPTDAADAAGTTLNNPRPRIRLSTENTSQILDGMEADAEALTKAGGWYQAIEAGHTFGKGEGVPWVKLNQDADVDNFMARVVDAAEERLGKLKGGATLPDAKVDKVVSQMSSLFNADPAQVLGMVQRAGADATTMVAQMETGYLVANRMFQDSYALASRISMGDFTEFGSRDAALAELKKRASIAASIYGSARSMTAAGGRAVRRMRAEFKIDPEAVKALNSVDADQLVKLLVDTEGNPRGVAKVLNPSMLSKVVDWGQFLLINNLVSGPKTQLINATTNAYMLGVRPMERMLGAAYTTLKGQGTTETNRIFKEASKQYAYLGTSFVEGFSLAKKAFMQNDSVMAPHRTEAYRGNQAVEQALAFKPWDSVGGLVHNALVVAATGIGLPTRTLGFVDEAVKQTVYRSKLMAAAHMDGIEQGLEAGLKDDALDTFVQTFVRDKVDAGFDELGRATDPGALREAQIATFQQDLLPNSVGKWLQQGVQQHPMLKLILPFVKTPTNVMRYGWKMTPGLNLLQSEYKDMLMGRMGAEARMQATGQMMVGGLFMGSAAYLVAQGHLTGKGTGDYKQRQQLMATGWQPYSVVIPHEDGSKTYVPYGRFDPVAVPFGIATDLMDALHAMGGETTPDWEAASAALLYAVSNQFTNKTYLVGVSQAMDALMQSDATKTQKAENWLGNTAANFIPYSAALRQLNPDPYMRDARDITDKLMATLPGYSEKVPPKRDSWGDPIQRVGLWSSDEDQLVDRETQRLILESGSATVPPQPVHNGVDLRDLTMSDGKNAFEEYQKFAGHGNGKGMSLKEVVARRIKSRAYQLAPDGDIGTKGTKLWLLHAPVSAYRERALKMLKRDPVVRDAFRAEDLKARAKFLENKAKSQPAEAPMKKLGDAFGVDLGALDTHH